MTRRLYVEPGDPRIRVVQPRKAASQVVKYNPEQTRDANGRFGQGSAGVDKDSLKTSKIDHPDAAYGGKDHNGKPNMVKIGTMVK